MLAPAVRPLKKKTSVIKPLCHFPSNMISRVESSSFCQCIFPVGRMQLSNIIFFSTGPKVVSKDITVESIEEVSKILRRAPVIWDNIHANDYDQKRLFLGPYKGRSTELIPRLKGVLTNPNCEFESNFVAIHTLATWYKSNMNGVRKDVIMSK